MYFICRAKQLSRSRVRDVFQFESYEYFIFIVKFNSFLSCNFSFLVNYSTEAVSMQIER